MPQQPISHTPVRRLRVSRSDETSAGLTKPFSQRRENRRKEMGSRVALNDQQRSSVMWNQLFSLIYRLSCRATLIEIGTHRLAR